VRVLDLGCGSGRDLARWGVTTSDQVTGLDIERNFLQRDQAQFCNRPYVQATGECLPFGNESFDRVVSAIALPYMNIPKALAEARRTLVPGGHLSLTVHPASFTLTELVHNALPKPIATLYRLYVFANGLFFHVTGRTFRFPKGKTESFQTQRGMRIALSRAGFVNVSFRWGTGRLGKTLTVEARRLESRSTLTALPAA
jgi:ubiquinone/menaquinone biosynthesis C-methylase UbiE